MLLTVTRYYNKTKFSGLETHIANSYTNPLLQLLRFTPLIRNVALHHTATTCLVATCLLCEMGFLFDMMEKAEGQSCQATNFLKTFSSVSEGMSCDDTASITAKCRNSFCPRAFGGKLSPCPTHSHDAGRLPLHAGTHRFGLSAPVSQYFRIQPGKLVYLWYHSC